MQNAFKSKSMINIFCKQIFSDFLAPCDNLSFHFSDSDSHHQSIYVLTSAIDLKNLNQMSFFPSGDQSNIVSDGTTAF